MSFKALDSERSKTLNKIDNINKKQRLMNYSFIAMLLFCGGFLFMYWDNVQPGSWQHTIAMICSIIGFILYIVIRAILLLTKQKKS